MQSSSEANMRRPLPPAPPPPMISDQGQEGRQLRQRSSSRSRSSLPKKDESRSRKSADASRSEKSRRRDKKNDTKNRKLVSLVENAVEKMTTPNKRPKIVLINLDPDEMTSGSVPNPELATLMLEDAHLTLETQRRANMELILEEKKRLFDEKQNLLVELANERKNTENLQKEIISERAAKVDLQHRYYKITVEAKQLNQKVYAKVEEIRKLRMELEVAKTQVDKCESEKKNAIQNLHVKDEQLKSLEETRMKLEVENEEQKSQIKQMCDVARGHTSGIPELLREKSIKELIAESNLFIKCEKADSDDESDQLLQQNYARVVIQDF